MSSKHPSVGFHEVTVPPLNPQIEITSHTDTQVT
jgi:hypothetical protein